MCDLFIAVNLRGRAGSFDLSYTWDEVILETEDAAPVQELAVHWALAFTGPQVKNDRIRFMILNGTLALPGSWSL